MGGLIILGALARSSEKVKSTLGTRVRSIGAFAPKPVVCHTCCFELPLGSYLFEKYVALKPSFLKTLGGAIGLNLLRLTISMRVQSMVMIRDFLIFNDC